MADPNENLNLPLKKRPTLVKSTLGRDPLPDLDNEVVRKQELEKVQLKAFYSVMLAFEEDAKYQSKIPPFKRVEITEKLIKEWNISTQTQIDVNAKIEAHLAAQPHMGDASSTPVVTAMQKPEGTSSANTVRVLN